MRLSGQRWGPGAPARIDVSAHLLSATWVLLASDLIASNLSLLIGKVGQGSNPFIRLSELDED